LLHNCSAGESLRDYGLKAVKEIKEKGSKKSRREEENQIKLKIELTKGD
jgi:hypothetical protein